MITVRRNQTRWVPHTRDRRASMHDLREQASWRWVRQRLYCVGGENEGGGGVHHIFILVPEERPLVLEFRIVGLDDHHARNHAAGNEGVIGPVVAIVFF